ncbi:MAG: peptidoglycan DD-metalloendopeptidase family protein [Chloroflexi bacterium]|nr:peptidoglycan DD-metalloendopeptidase family protein [Chloroflexota bacterium]
MRPVRSVARPRALMVLLTLSALTVVAFSGASQPTTARPPSGRFNVPSEAFTPVTVPTDLTATSSTSASDDPLPGPLWGARLQLAAEGTAEQPVAPAGPEHVVRSGDSLWQIAAWHRADLQLIVRWNPGIDPRRLIAGQRILVPGGSAMAVRAPVVSTSGAKTARWSTGAGHLWPLPIRGTITTRFSSAHRGVDIAAPAGTPVRAIAGGTVIWAGWSTTGGGNVVEIRHPDGMRSRYLHNRTILVSVGQVVVAGEQIAQVGSTGWSTGPHLDLRIEMGGRFIDPLRLAWSR